MEPKGTDAPVSPEAIARGHEGTEISLKSLIVFVVVFIVVGVVVHLVLWVALVGMLHQDQKRELAEMGPASPLLKQHPHSKPPKPNLQPSLSYEVSEDADFGLLKAEQSHYLTTAGPTTQGSQRIPIDEAKRLVLQKGFPTAAPSEGSEKSR